MHLLPPCVAPTETALGRPCAGSHPPHRKNRERRQQRGVKRRREREKKERCESRTQRRACVCAPSRTDDARAGPKRQLLSPGGQLPHYPLPPRARPRARCTTRSAPAILPPCTTIDIGSGPIASVHPCLTPLPRRRLCDAPHPTLPIYVPVECYV